jgi:hypothetical protein
MLQLLGVPYSAYTPIRPDYISAAKQEGQKPEVALDIRKSLRNVWMRVGSLIKKN